MSKEQHKQCQIKCLHPQKSLCFHCKVNFRLQKHFKYILLHHIAVHHISW